MNGIRPYRQIVRRLKRILKLQESWREQDRLSKRLLQDCAVDLHPRPISIRQRKLKSVQQLTSQKNSRQLQGTRHT